jgi:hypothetical protein
VSTFLHTGTAVDVILAVVGIEAILLLAVHLVTGRGLAPLDVLGQLMAGVMLLAALRCALTGADGRWTLGFLAASFPAHVFDLVRRWRRPDKPPPRAAALPRRSG